MNSQQINILRQMAEGELREILSEEYGLTADVDTPVLYYLDFKTNQRLLELRDVLERMDRGTFGICMVCGEPIPDSRLADSPGARLCETCIPVAHAVMNAPLRCHVHAISATADRR